MHMLTSSIFIICDKPCFSQATTSCVEHVAADTCEGLINQGDDNPKKEVKEPKSMTIKLTSKAQVQLSQDNHDHMVKKFEKGSIITFFAPQQGQAKRKDLVQSQKSNLEHSTCSMNSKNKIKLPRREKYRARTRVCFRCKEKGHLIAACPIQQSEVGSDLTGHPRPVRPVGAQNAQPHSYKCNQESNSWVKPKMKQVQNIKDNSEASKVKHRTCYTCREK